MADDDDILHATAKEVRAWAVETDWRDEWGREVSDIGRIPGKLRRDYLRATGVPYYEGHELKRLREAHRRNRAKAQGRFASIGKPAPKAKPKLKPPAMKPTPPMAPEAVEWLRDLLHKSVASKNALVQTEDLAAKITRLATSLGEMLTRIADQAAAAQEVEDALRRLIDLDV